MIMLFSIFLFMPSPQACDYCSLFSFLFKILSILFWRGLPNLPKSQFSLISLNSCRIFYDNIQFLNVDCIVLILSLNFWFKILTYLPDYTFTKLEIIKLPDSIQNLPTYKLSVNVLYWQVERKGSRKHTSTLLATFRWFYKLCEVILVLFIWVSSLWWIRNNGLLTLVTERRKLNYTLHRVQKQQ